MHDTPLRDCPSTSASGGFSLIELMVSVVLIAAITLAVTLRLPSLGRDSATETGDKLTRAFDFLGTESFFRSKSYAVAFDAHGWRVLDYQPEDRSWRPRDQDRLYATGLWPSAARVAFWIEGRQAILEPRSQSGQETVVPDVFLLSNGEATPFELRIAGARGAPVRCEMTALEGFSCTPDPV